MNRLNAHIGKRLAEPRKIFPKVNMTIYELTTGDRPKKIETVKQTVSLISENLPPDIAYLVTRLYDRNEWFSLTVHTGKLPGDKIYKIWRK